MTESFVPILLEQLVVGQPLPGNLYVNIDSRHLTFRAEGDVLDQVTFDRLQFKKVNNLFIREEDQKKFAEWTKQIPPAAEGPQGSKENATFIAAWKQTHRKTLDIFQSAHPDQQIAGVIHSSKNLVTEVMKFPYAVQSLAQLQTFSRGTVDHSINVAILSVYLAMQMGYSHTIILQHVGLGGLLHDVGKRKIDIQDTDSKEAIAAKMREHPALGVRILDAVEQIPNDVKNIVAQHHELNDGSGYPKKLRGSKIFDLARIVSIANIFDHLVSNGTGTLQERQKAAVKAFDRDYFNKVDPDKHEKTVRILRLGI